MGTGKSTWAIQEMNNHKDRKYIYITPYLDEVKRIKERTASEFYDPLNHGKGKLDSFLQLAQKNRNIVSTHSLFTRISKDMLDYIKNGHYTLFIDEAMNVVDKYSDLKKGDWSLLFNEKIIKVEKDTNYLCWDENKQYFESKYEPIMLLAQNRSLIYVNRTIAIWHYPPEIFNCFDCAYVLTYLFDGQILKHYFDYFNIPYSLKSVSKENDIFCMQDYNPNNEPREIFKALIHICDNNKLNKVGSDYYALSTSWYKKKLNDPSLDEIKRDLRNYFTNITKATSPTIMWTTFKDYRARLQGKGYINAVSKGQLPPNPTKSDIDKAKCFVSCNCRATNDYANRFNCAYTINKFIDPYISSFFKHKDIQFDEDLYALSELLQWLWRSQIRNMKPINVYIPSDRMRNLLVLWLNHDERNNYRKLAS